MPEISDRKEVSMDHAIASLDVSATELVRKLIKTRQNIVFAESCTAGLLAATMGRVWSIRRRQSTSGWTSAKTCCGIPAPLVKSSANWWQKACWWTRHMRQSLPALQATSGRTLREIWTELPGRQWPSAKRMGSRCIRVGCSCRRQQLKRLLHTWTDCGFGMLDSSLLHNLCCNSACESRRLRVVFPDFCCKRPNHREWWSVADV